MSSETIESNEIPEAVLTRRRLTVLAAGIAFGACVGFGSENLGYAVAAFMAFYVFISSLYECTDHIADAIRASK